MTSPTPTTDAERSPMDELQDRAEILRKRSMTMTAAMKAQARLNGIRELCGYVQDSSQKTVRIFQDDATRTWFVEVAGKSSFGDSFEQAIDAAMSLNQESSK